MRVAMGRGASDGGLSGALGGKQPCAYPNVSYLKSRRACVLAKLLQSCPTLCDPMNCSLPNSSVHRILPSKNTGVGCHALLQGIFLTQALDLPLLHGRQICECWATEEAVVRGTDK